MAIVLAVCALLAVQDGPACEKCGKPVCVTTVRWMGSPSEAAMKAKAEEKLVLVVHSSGDFLDPTGAFSNPQLGDYLDRHFVAAFQKLAGLRPSGGPRRPGVLVSYFCAPDGRVLHCVAGAVEPGTLLREAKWVVESATKGIEESGRTEVPFKAVFRRMHAERLRREYGLAVEPVTFDAPEPAEDDPLTWRDPSGRPLAPPLIPPPIDGPDVQFRALAKEAKDGIPDRRGSRWALGAQGRIHQLLAAHALVKIEKLYATVFSIAGERVPPGPLKTVLPRDPERKRICLGCEGE
jgi:hypothetical protein